jgi:hypothetical protein
MIVFLFNCNQMLRALCAPGFVCCSLLKPVTTTTTSTAAPIIIQTPSPASTCGLSNTLGTITKIFGDNATTATVFAEFPWMVAILEKTDAGLRYYNRLTQDYGIID